MRIRSKGLYESLASFKENIQQNYLWVNISILDKYFKQKKSWGIQNFIFGH
jgi:hypothetical protein